MPNDLKTQAIVLRRTNYGESDRILNLLTPEGKIAVLAKGVRKEKSKLAGGIELFSVAEVIIHQGKSSLGTLTSAKMLSFYSNILSDLARLTLASEFLKKADRAAEQVDNPDYFCLVQQALQGLHLQANLELVKTWFLLNFAQAIGEEINLFTDTNGEPLNSELHYFWDHAESALRPDVGGTIDAQAIKLGRIMLSSPLRTVLRITNTSELISALAPVVQAYGIMNA